MLPLSATDVADPRSARIGRTHTWLAAQFVKALLSRWFRGTQAVKTVYRRHARVHVYRIPVTADQLEAGMQLRVPKVVEPKAPLAVIVRPLQERLWLMYFRLSAGDGLVVWHSTSPSIDQICELFG